MEVAKYTRVKLLNWQYKLFKNSRWFDVQGGAVFGFSTHADDDLWSLVKVADATEEEMEELNKIAIHDLREERSIGSIKNELEIRGKGVLRKLVLNKSFDLLEKKHAKDST